MLMDIISKEKGWDGLEVNLSGCAGNAEDAGGLGWRGQSRWAKNFDTGRLWR